MASASDYIEIDAPVERCFEYWRDFTNFPSFMEDVREVTPTGGDTYRWVVDGPAGKAVEWEARVTEEVPNRKIAWESVEDADDTLRTAGNVQFEDKGGRTAITVSLSYDPPAGFVGEFVAKLTSNNPEEQVRRALESFKEIAQSWSTAA